jgi:hypothetical protein
LAQSIEAINPKTALALVLLFIANALAAMLMKVMVSSPPPEMNGFATMIFGTQLPEEFPLIYRIAVSTALPLGALQFSVMLFRRKRQVHFLLGNIYVLLTLFLASPLLLVMSLSQTNNLLLLTGSVVSLYWWRCTRLSIRLVAEGDLPGHAKWMYRSFAAMLACSLLSSMFYYTVPTPYQYAVWLLLLLILIVPEILIRRGQHKVMLRNFLSSK